MTSGPQTQGWWIASDGRWYPPHLHPGSQSRARPVSQPPAPAGSAWWVASDGRWYPPQLHPHRRTAASEGECRGMGAPAGVPTLGHEQKPPAPAPRRGWRRNPGNRWPRALKLGAAALGVALVGSAAYGATLWVVGLGTGSSGQAKFGTVSNITITAVASPTPTNLLYPHGTGDVVAKVTNPNHFPVTITKVKLPKSTVYGTGYSTSSLTTTKAACGASATGSDVSWHYSNSTTGSAHTLHTAITVAASGQSGDPLTVTFTNDASMGTTASATCEGIYLKMPSLIGITGYAGGSATPDSSPFTDKWTS